MTKKDKQVLIEGLKKLSADVADIAALLEGTEAPAKTQDAPAKDPAPMPEKEAPAKVYTHGPSSQRSPGLVSEQRSKRFSPRTV